MYKQFSIFSSICLLLFLSSQDALGQERIDSNEVAQDSVKIPFSDFLKTLTDSTAEKINTLQSTLANTQDRLDQIKHSLNTQLTEYQQLGQPDAISSMDDKIENVGYLNEELVSLSRAVVNLQSSSEIEFELAYIEESKEFLLGEVAKYSSANLKSSSAHEITSDTLKNNNVEEDLSSYNFEVHPLSDLKELTDFECNIISKAEKKYTSLAPFFSFTPEKLENHFLGTDYISCDAQVAQVDDLYFVNLNIEIRSKTAKDIYGGIEKGSALRLELINGEQILVYNVKRDFGKQNQAEESVVYQVIYSLDPDDLKTLSKFDLNRIGIIWTTGYEDYEIFETDFLINHLKCLNNH